MDELEGKANRERNFSKKPRGALKSQNPSWPTSQGKSSRRHPVNKEVERCLLGEEPLR